MINNSFHIEGNKDKAIFLIHGLTGAPIEMHGIAKLLHKDGFSSYAPLIKGHCNGIKNLAQTTWHTWYNSLAKSLENYYNKKGKVHILGLCAGGTLGLLLAKNFPHMVKSIAIYSTILNYNGWNMPFYYSYSYYLLNPVLKILPFLKRITLKETFPFGIKNNKIRELLLTVNSPEKTGILEAYPLISLNEYIKLIKVVKKDLRKITNPLLLVHSIYDEVSHPKGALYIQKKYGGICDIHLINNSYHLINIDQQKNMVAKQTTLFFNNYSL